MRATNGGGQTKIPEKRKIFIEDIALTEGYKIELVVENLTFPSGITFDESGIPYVIEAGYAYGEEWTTPTLLKLNEGKSEVVARGERNGPWTGVDYHNGSFYIAEGGTIEGGKILKISEKGEITSIIEDLPSRGDHHTNGPVVHKGDIYFGIGAASNSAVIGEDNFKFGWLERFPDFHDIPCRDITLNGLNFETKNVLSKNKNGAKVSTGAFVPFSARTDSGQVIKGKIPCTASILKISVTGGKPELVAWGIRNPYGLSFSPDGKLYVTENNYDDRGSRPVWGSGDVLWEVQDGKWYGWPDYSEGRSLTENEFKPPHEKPLKPLIHSLNEPLKPAAIFGVHSSACGLDFSRSEKFGFVGEAFVAEFGDMAPNVGKVLMPVGFKVVRVNVKNGVVEDFAVNKGKKNGPATWLKKGGLERPVAVKFNPAGDALYIVDFGIMKMADGGAYPQKNTGVVWKITKL